MLGGKNKQSGYTIIEVIIVLAISGAMFLIAANFISGKQSRTSFSQGVNEMASQVQNAIGQVTDGHYSDVPLQCTFNSTTSDTDATGASTAEQGQNAPCVFLGKILYFTQGSNNYTVMSVAGGRMTPTSNDPATALLAAGPVGVKSLQVNQLIPQNLNVWNISSTDPGGTAYSYRAHAAGGNWSTNALGFFQSQGTAADGVVASGAQSVSLYQVWGSNDAHGQYKPGAGTHVLAASSICLTDGYRYGEVRIGNDTAGAGSSPLSVTVKMDGTTPC